MKIAEAEQCLGWDSRLGQSSKSTDFTVFGNLGNFFNVL